MTAGIAPAELVYRGQRCIEISSNEGGRVIIALQGAQVLSWQTAGGREIFYLCPDSAADGHTAIRGGVPICFPQFNMRVLGDSALPKHGFARNQLWSPLDTLQSEDTVEAGLTLSSSKSTLALWPHSFTAMARIRLEADRLRIGFELRNTGSIAWPFALALHSYFQVDDALSAELNGLEQLQYWDAVRHFQEPERRLTQPSGPVKFDGETDRVYEGAPAPLTLQHTGGSVRISQSASLPETVVWNPGATLCAAIGDMPADGWRRMVCVEAASINQPRLLAPGESWSGWQAIEPSSPAALPV